MSGYHGDLFPSKTVQYPSNWLVDTIDRILPSPSIMYDRGWLRLNKTLQEAPDRVLRTFRVNIPYIEPYWLVDVPNDVLLKIHGDALNNMSLAQLRALRAGNKNTPGRECLRELVTGKAEYQSRFQLIDQLIEKKKCQEHSIFFKIRQLISSILRFFPKIR